MREPHESAQGDPFTMCSCRERIMESIQELCIALVSVPGKVPDWHMVAFQYLFIKQI